MLLTVAFLFFFGTDSTDFPDCLKVGLTGLPFFYYLDLVHPVPAGTLGDESPPLGTISDNRLCIFPLQSDLFHTFVHPVLPCHYTQGDGDVILFHIYPALL